MPKYEVVFCSYGYVRVDAKNKDEAIDKATEISTWDHFEQPEYVRIEELDDEILY